MSARKVAVVTGAGTGVGRAVTLALMKEGYAVVLAGRRKDMLDAVAGEGAQTPGEALAVPTDVADPASIKALFDKTKAVYSRLDGGTFSITGARGRPLFLDFFASWCVPCKIEMPLVERWARAHPDVRVVAVDVGEPRAAALAFARRYQLENVVLDPASTARPYFGVEGFPTIVVVDAGGYIRAKWEGLNLAIELAMTNARRKL